ncbi:hypothetical protein [Aulosira sp. FACHB-615]|uniref:hypothetical protein n=1 Tax=Aulosira sp. FACHB-615 TaxID=2692777 RepID=UPI0016870317|nr:hypothetical protein [Aulosira sp. FACHB-615]MBD2489503.1 hypothetical protein [Aulosira sp. FACHB-615]
MKKTPFFRRFLVLTAINTLIINLHHNKRDRLTSLTVNRLSLLLFMSFKFTFLVINS